MGTAQKILVMFLTAWGRIWNMVQYYVFHLELVKWAIQDDFSTCCIKNDHPIHGTSDSIENLGTLGPNKLYECLTTYLIKRKAFKRPRNLEVFKAWTPKVIQSRDPVKPGEKM